MILSNQPGVRVLQIPMITNSLRQSGRISMNISDNIMMFLLNYIDVLQTKLSQYIYIHTYIYIPSKRLSVILFWERNECRNYTSRHCSYYTFSCIPYYSIPTLLIFPFLFFPEICAHKHLHYHYYIIKLHEVWLTRFWMVYLMYRIFGWN